MKKLLLIFFLFSLASCKNISENEDVKKNNIVTHSPELTLAERNEKLIEATKSVSGIINADVSGSILTVQVTSIDSDEAQKLASGILNEVKKHKQNGHIKTVTIWDSNKKLQGYAGQ